MNTGASIPLLKSRRTHCARRTYDEAMSEAFNLARLLNGTPEGWASMIGKRMGAFVLFSCRIEDWNAAQEDTP